MADLVVTYEIEQSGLEIEFYAGNRYLGSALAIPMTDDYDLRFEDLGWTPEYVREGIDLVWHDAVNDALQAAFEAANEPSF